MENYAGLPTDEAGLLAQYERMKGSNEVWDFDAEDEEAFRQAVLEELESEKN